MLPRGLQHSATDRTQAWNPEGHRTTGLESSQAALLDYMGPRESRSELTSLSELGWTTSQVWKSTS